MTDIDAPQPPSPDEMEEVFEALDEAISRLQDDDDHAGSDRDDGSTSTHAIP